MIDVRAGKRYAGALMSMVAQSGQAAAVDQAFSALCQIMDQHPQLKLLAANSSVPVKDKEALLKKLLGDETPSVLLNFLKVLIRKRRFRELSTIQECFHRLYEKSQGILDALVITAAPLAQGSEPRLAAVLKKKFRSEIRLKTEVNPKILGGMIIRVEGQEMDLSFRSRLYQLRQSLMMQS